MASFSHPILTVGGIEVELVRKDIKNIHIGVYPPDGRARIAVPLHIDDAAARLAVVNKLPWLKRQVTSFAKQSRLSEVEVVTGESWYLFGQRYRLRVNHRAGRPEIVKSTNTRIDLFVPADCDRKVRLAIMDRWCRSQLRDATGSLIKDWQSQIGVEAKYWGIRRMKTKWGSCNHESSRIWFNSELAKKPIECLEYIVVHELIHLIEPSHNANFVQLMENHLPSWESLRNRLNSAPLAYEEWKY